MEEANGNCRLVVTNMLYRTHVGVNRRNSFWAVAPSYVGSRYCMHVYEELSYDIFLHVTTLNLA